MVLAFVLLLSLGAGLAYTQERLTDKKEHLAQTASSSGEPPQHHPENKSTPLPDLNEVHNLVNAERQKEGIKPLIRISALDNSAQDKCDDMVARNYWDHNTPDGVEPWSFIKNYTTYTEAGENLLFSDTVVPLVAVESWMNSPGHRKNLLKKEFLYVGYAACTSTDYVSSGPSQLLVQHLKR